MKAASTAPLGTSPNADFVTNNVFWVGMYAGLTKPLLDFVAGVVTDFASKSISNLRIDPAVLTSFEEVR